MKYLINILLLFTLSFSLSGQDVRTAKAGGSVGIPKKTDCEIPVNLEEICKRTFEFIYDNGVTPESSINNCGRQNYIRFDWVFESTGWTTGAGILGDGEPIGAYLNWGNQLSTSTIPVSWINFGLKYDPYGSDHTFAFKPSPTWRSWVVSGCNPDAKYGVWNLKRDNGCEYTVFPALYTEKIVKVYRSTTMNCDGVMETRYYDINKDGQTYTQILTPDNIDCFIPCEKGFEPVIIKSEEIPCVTKDRILCDRVDENDSSMDVQFVLVIDICQGKKTRYRYTLSSYNNSVNPDDLVTYSPIGKVYVCGTNEVFIEEPDECEVDGTFTLFSYENITETLRNREWEYEPTKPTSYTLSEFSSDRENLDLTRTTTVDSDWNNGLSVDDSSNLSTTSDDQIIEGYMLVTEKTTGRWSGGSYGYFALEYSDCCNGDCEEPQLVLEKRMGGTNGSITNEFEFEVGLHKFYLYNLDDYANTSRTFQYTLDDGLTWINGTPSWIKLSRKKITELCKNIKSCTNGNYIDLRGSEVDINECYDCSLFCTSTNSNESCTPIIAIESEEETSKCSQFDSTYEILLNTTDISFSSNTTDMKWNQSTGGNPDGAKSFTQSAMDCIDSAEGAVAEITHYDSNNVEYQFNANSYSGDAGGSALFSGTGVIAGSGKLTKAILTCKCE